MWNGCRTYDEDGQGCPTDNRYIAGKGQQSSYFKLKRDGQTIYCVILKGNYYADSHTFYCTQGIRYMA